MIFRTLPLLALLGALATVGACSRPAEQTAANQTGAADASDEAPAPPASDYANMAIDVPGPGEPGGLPDDRTPLTEGPITPGSAEAAGQTVQHYVALLEQRRFDEAAALWEGKLPDLTARYADYVRIGANVGKPGRVDAGAGQLHVEVPIQLYGRLDDGTVVNGAGKVSLHRVKDIDGATAEEKSWRIVKIDAEPAPLSK